MLVYRRHARWRRRPVSRWSSTPAIAPKIVDWLDSTLPDSDSPSQDGEFGDDTIETAMIAVQGPKAIEVAASVMRSLDRVPLSDLRMRVLLLSTRQHFGGDGVLRQPHRLHGRGRLRDHLRRRDVR